MAKIDDITVRFSDEDRELLEKVAKGLEELLATLQDIEENDPHEN